jgi:hypothetical protein
VSRRLGEARQNPVDTTRSIDLNKRTSTSTQTVVRTTQRELQKALQRADLSREEELVLRMRHGITEPKSAKLEFRGQGDPELSAKLAMIEASVLDSQRGAPAQEDLQGDALKHALVERLKRL